MRVTDNNTKYELFCRRYPPSVAIIDAPVHSFSMHKMPIKAMSTTFPPVADDWWCGEWQSKIPPATEDNKWSPLPPRPRE
jgi:hypothetical protein